MNKNIIFFHLDSLVYKGIEKTSERDIAMPFFEELSKRGVMMTNLFSLAPYTEAAAIALYSGRKTLDNGGYLNKFIDDEKFITKKLDKAG